MTTAPPPAHSPATRRYDVVFCDVDGCLLPEAARPADVIALGAIAEHNARAARDRDRPTVVPCTGRPQPFAEAVCKLLGDLDGLPAVCEHGAWTFWYERNRWELAPDISPADLAAVRTVEAWVRDELAREGCFLQLGKHACVTIFHDDVGYLHGTLKPRIEALIAERGWPFRVSTTRTCVNVDLRHVSKAKAIGRVIERLGLDRDRMAGIGDTMGDLAIREQVAWFGCPANALDGLKERADAVAPSGEARGVVELLAML